MKTLTVGILAHVDAGKTTLTEQLLYASGETRAPGSVDAGTAQTDFLAVERERGISVKASGVSLTLDDTRLQLIDTPGHVDFAAEVERALTVLDTAVLLVSAADGIQAQTEIIWEALRATQTNVVIFINKIDRAGSHTAALLDEMRERFSPHLLLFTAHSGEGEKTCASALRDLAEPAFIDEAMDALAPFDGDPAVAAALERYLDGEPPSPATLTTLLAAAIARGDILPVLCGSGFYGVGVRPLLELLRLYGEPVKNLPGDALSAVVFRITHDKTMGRVAHVRLFGGELRSRDSVTLCSAATEDGVHALPPEETPQPQKITQIRRYHGPRYVDIGAAAKGDIAALCGLQGARIGDIIGESAALARYPLSVPLLQVQALPARPEELLSLRGALEELSAEDSHLAVTFHPDEREITLRITGAIQLEILPVLVRERFGLDVAFSPPTVIYRETPARRGTGHEAYTMPKPCWAVITLDIEPLPPGSGLRFASRVPYTQMHYKYQTHIETALPRALKQGLYNWEVVDLAVTLVGGGSHVQHTHPLDFFLATPLAVIDGLQNTGATLLEPLQTLRVAADEALVGKVIGDMVAMRGRYDAPVFHGGSFTLEALVPVSASLDYAVRLASLSGGRATLSTRFAGYAPCALELGALAKRRGLDPRNRDRWILHHRSAMRERLL